MWPVRYFTAAYWAARYWPKVGSDQVHEVTPRVLAVPRRAVLQVPQRRVLAVPPPAGR